MKYIILLSLLFSLKCLFAQEDIMRSKLQEYKKLYEDSLITQQEYDKLRGNIINPAPAPTTRPVVKNIDSLLNVANFQIAGGSACIGFGLVPIISGIWYTKHKVPVLKIDNRGNINAEQYKSDVANYKKIRILCFTTGSVLIATGVVLDALGIVHREKYLNQKKGISVAIATENLGIKFNF